MSGYNKAGLLFVSVLAFVGVSPVMSQAWVYQSESLTPVVMTKGLRPLLESTEVDLDQDGQAECLRLNATRAEIWRQLGCSGNSPQSVSGEILWRSPASWQVLQANSTDLNHDGQGEITLLIWRPFTPWPIDRYLPHKGRIQSFQNADGLSCHLILIGWQRGKYRELWAGSALANPLRTFAAGDLNADGLQELVVLESDYDDLAIEPAHILSVWEWNGFGFTRFAGVEGDFHRLAILTSTEDQSYILTQ